jgi:hypothetical protein
MPHTAAVSTPQGAWMAQYYVRFVNRVDAVINLVELEADSDEAAIEQAYRIKLQSVGAGFDVLEDNRLVHRHRDR